MIQSLYIYPH